MISLEHPADGSLGKLAYIEFQEEEQMLPLLTGCIVKILKLLLCYKCENLREHSGVTNTHKIS